ncbi:MAG TPA: PfkB family carbohydrate kinase [Terriglobales bacterium]|nr:PfkB family carbohydrate kinase [Terriglobales bacterium]
MAVLVVGSVAFDGIQTPSGKVDRCLGGSATYFSLAASFFTDVRVVAVVGDDFTAEDEAVMGKRGIDTSGIQRAKGKSFFWAGEYGDNLNEAKTLRTDLNVFEKFDPQIPPDFLGSEYLFLANIDPVLQGNVRKQMSDARLVGGDTMNFWITGKAKDLAQTLEGIDILMINDGEARMLGGKTSLLRASKKILAMGPRILVIKHGEYGATAFFREAGLHPFRAPALPIEEVVDPTGAGDCFAGGFMGYIAAQPELNREVLKRAMFYGGVMGSFAVERFGTQRLQELSRGEIDARFQLFRELSHLD